MAGGMVKEWSSSRQQGEDAAPPLNLNLWISDPPVIRAAALPRRMRLIRRVRGEIEIDDHSHDIRSHPLDDVVNANERMPMLHACAVEDGCPWSCICERSGSGGGAAHR